MESFAANRPIAVIGAGPAGLSASLFLSKAGIHHILLDRAAFPREKVCGESYDGKVWHTLRRVDPELPARMIRAGIVRPGRRYSLRSEEGFHLPICFPQGATPRLQGRRLHLDQFLLDEVLAAGVADWRPATPVNIFEPVSAGWRLYTRAGDTIETSAVLWAAGSQAKGPFWPKGQKGRGGMLFTRAYFRGVRPATHAEEIELIFIKKPIRACVVLCPLPGGLHNVEVGIRFKDYARLSYALPKWLGMLVQNHPLLAPRFSRAVAEGLAGGAYMNLHHFPTRLSGRAWLAAGSAAMEVNPVTGMGVGNAMLTGRLAAEHLIALRQKKAPFSESNLLAYDRTVHQALRREVLFSRLVTSLQHQVDALEPLLQVLARTRRVRHWLQQPDLVRQFTNLAFYRRK